MNIWMLIHALIVVAFGYRIIMARHLVGTTFAWLLVIVLFPYVGALAYLAFGERFLGRQRLNRADHLMEKIKPWFQSKKVKIDQESIQIEPTWQPLRQLAETALGSPVLPGNTIELHSDSAETWQCVIRDIDAAKSYCLMTFYIWAPGGLVDDVGHALIRAAQRGVTCKVLLDSVGSLDFWKTPWPRQLRDAGVELSAALPVGILRTFVQRVDLRLHRKSIVIDNQIAYTGSLNMIDPRYFKQGAGVGEWVDGMVRITGPIVELQAGLALWDLALDDKHLTVETDLMQNAPPVQHPNTGSDTQLVPSGPGFAENTIVSMLISALYKAEKSVTLTTPYFVPNDELQNALCVAAERGVKVRLIVPTKVDSTMVAYVSHGYFADLMKAGVEIYSFDAGLLHTKSVVVDDDLSIFGTVNLDLRSFQLNFEMSLVIYDKDFHDRLLALQESYIQKSHRLDPERWAKRPWQERFLENVMLLVSPFL